MAKNEYCTECKHLEERTAMAETEMDSGKYVASGFYFKCKACGRAIHANREEIEFYTCCCGEYEKRTF